MGVEITVVRVEIIVVSVVITFVRVKITMRLIGNHTMRVESHYACGITLCVWNHTLRVEIVLCV
jgi:hypothetical protein